MLNVFVTLNIVKSRFFRSKEKMELKMESKFHYFNLYRTHLALKMQIMQQNRLLRQRKKLSSDSNTRASGNLLMQILLETRNSSTFSSLCFIILSIFFLLFFIFLFFSFSYLHFFPSNENLINDKSFDWRKANQFSSISIRYHFQTQQILLAPHNYMPGGLALIPCQINIIENSSISLYGFRFSASLKTLAVKLLIQPFKSHRSSA